MKKAYIQKFLKLLQEQDDYKKTGYFAGELNVSTKTISNYIAELNYLLQENGAQIVTKAGVGIRLETGNADRNTLDTVLFSEATDSEQRRREIRERLLMFDEQISIRKCAEEYYVSSTSIVKDLELLETQFQKQELSLEKTKKGTRLAGKEQRLRSAKREYIFEELEKNHIHRLNDVKKLMTRYIPEKDQKIALEIIDCACRAFDTRLDRTYYVSIFITYSIFVGRIRKKCWLKKATIRPVATELHGLKTYPVIESIAFDLMEKYGLYIPPIDLRWMNARFAGVYHENLRQNEASPQIVHEMVMDMVTYVGDVVGEDLNRDDQLIGRLENHFVPMLSRLKNNIRISNPFIDAIKQEYSATFMLVSLSAGIIERRLDVLLSDDEIGFILVHFQAALESKDLSKKILVLYDCPVSNAQLIQNHIRMHLPTFDVLEMIPAADFRKEYLKDFDMVISTTELPFEIGKPLCMISQLAGPADMQRVQEAYQGLIRRPVNLQFHHLLQAMGADMISVKRSFDDRYELLHYANDKLTEAGLVEPEFLESVFAREKLSSTEIGNGIATPHGQEKFVRKSGIVLVTLDKPVLWDKSYVSVIFLIAISFEDRLAAKEIVKELYNLICSKENVEVLRSAANKRDILRLLYHEKQQKERK